MIKLNELLRLIDCNTFVSIINYDGDWIATEEFAFDLLSQPEWSENSTSVWMIKTDVKFDADYYYTQMYIILNEK